MKIRSPSPNFDKALFFFFWILFALFMLTGCASSYEPPKLTPTTVEVTKYVVYPCGTPPKIGPVSYLDVTWQLMKGPDENTVWVLTAEEYEDLGRNTSTTVRAVKELAAERDFWKDCQDRAMMLAESENAEREEREALTN